MAIKTGDVVPADSKRCHVCRKVKPRSEFKFNAKRNLHASRCCECHKQYMKEYYQKNKEKWNEARAKRQPRINAEKRRRYREDAEYRRKIIERVDQYRAANPEAVRCRKLRASYGITAEHYDSLLESQGGRCAICGRTQSNRKRVKFFHVDHDHVTGIVRGLLCSACNCSLGMMRDDPATLRAAAEYLERSKESIDAST